MEHEQEPRPIAEATAAPGVEASAAPDLSTILEQFKAPLKAQLDALTEKREAILARHRQELQGLEEERARIIRVLRATDPDEFANVGRRPTTTRKARRTRPSSAASGEYRKLAPERLDQLRNFVIEHLRKNDSVTQVDARLALAFDSSDTAVGFRSLRDENTLRQAGQRGNMKYYKLTHPAADKYLNAHDNAQEASIGPINP